MKVLIDSNVIISYLDGEHQHHRPSRAVFQSLRDEDILIASHSLLEAYNKLTRGVTTKIFSSDHVALTLRRLAARVPVRALTALETLAAIDEFARRGGRGARVYDYLIGYVAIVESARSIVTWNHKDFATLFPSLEVMTPATFSGDA